MSSDATTHTDAGHGGGGHTTHHYNYVKIWVVLLVLLAFSILGPMLEIPTVTLITAFGIAFVKAFIVIKYFMHLTVEKKYIGFLLLTMIAFMIIFVGGVSPDVMRHEGQRWTNTAAQDVVTKGLAADKAAAGHGEGHHP
jgi:caa(3)-type oxidase subunit IV